MRERDLLNDVVATARLFGWRVFHVPMPVRPIPGGKFVPERNARGLPDLILLHDDPPRLVFAELKGDGGRLADEQAEFLRLVADVQREASYPDGSYWVVPLSGYVWTPADRDAYTTILRSKVLA